MDDTLPTPDEPADSPEPARADPGPVKDRRPGTKTHGDESGNDLGTSAVPNKNAVTPAAYAVTIPEAAQALSEGGEASTGDPAHDAAAADPLWRTYGMINEWIRFADAKAGVILTANVVIASTAIAGLKGERAFLLGNPGVLIFTIVGAVSLLASTGLCLACTMPRTGGVWKTPGNARSPLYFGHIAVETLEDFRRSARKLGTADGAFRALTGQVWVNSRVALRKHDLVRWAIATMSLSLFCSLIVAVAATW